MLSNVLFLLSPNLSSYGGAIYASEKSRLSWSGQTTFINNSVTGNFGNRTSFCNGGVVAADARSSSVVDGENVLY